MSDNNTNTPETASTKSEVPVKGRKDQNTQAQRAYVKEIIDANTRIAVRIQKTERYRPYYSLVIGKFVEHENGESFVPYIPVHVDTHLAKVEKVSEHAKLIAQMVSEATDWIREKAQLREDEIIDEKQKREQTQMDRQKGPGAKPGLKQLTKIDRAVKNYG